LREIIAHPADHLCASGNGDGCGDFSISCVVWCNGHHLGYYKEVEFCRPRPTTVVESGFPYYDLEIFS
jgi:hypothetical protein